MHPELDGGRNEAVLIGTPRQFAPGPTILAGQIHGLNVKMKNMSANCAEI
jgi:hypothetical protein